MGGKLGTIFARAGHEVVFTYARSEEKLKKLAWGVHGCKKTSREEFRNGYQKKWLTALRQRTGRVFYRHGTH